MGNSHQFPINIVSGDVRRTLRARSAPWPSGSTPDSCTSTASCWESGRRRYRLAAGTVTERYRCVDFPADRHYAMRRHAAPRRSARCGDCGCGVARPSEFRRARCWLTRTGRVVALMRASLHHSGQPVIRKWRCDDRGRCNTTRPK